MQKRLLLRRLVDSLILVLVVITVWRVLTVTREPLANSSIAGADAVPVKSGDVLRLASVEWSAPRTVVLVVSSTCPACNANVAFYRQLAHLATSQVHVIAVSDQPEGVTGGWLRQNQVNMTSVHKVSDPLSHGLTLTPMVLIVNGEGRITDLMIRKLDATDQARVLERVRNPAAMALNNSQQFRDISTADLQRMRSRRIQIVDVRSRDQFFNGHRADARNIPSAELAARAPIELDSARPVIIDCLQPKATGCRGAGWTLVDADFPDVSVLIR